MHRIVARIVLMAIFALLILSFALWGTGDLLRGRISSGAVASVGGAEIPQGEFLRAWQNREVPQGRTRGQREADEALRILVDSELLKQEGESLRLRLGAEDISREVADYAAFQGPGGDFDPLRFENFLRGTGFSEAEFAERFGRDIQTQRLQSALLSGVQGTEPLARLLTEYDEAQRVARYIRVVTEDQPETELPPESELEAYYETIKNDYRSHEQRRASWVWLDPEVFRAEVEVDESALREAYDESVETRFTEPERRTFWQEVVASEDEARSLLDEYAARADELAATVDVPDDVSADSDGDGDGDNNGVADGDSDGAVAGDNEGIEVVVNGDNNSVGNGDSNSVAEAEETEEEPVWNEIFAAAELGPITREEIDPAMADAIFAADAGLLGDIVKSPFGWHVVAVGDIEAEVVTSYDDARAELEEEYIDSAIADRVIEEANRFDEVLNSGLTLAESADELGLDLGSGSFNSFGYDPDGAQGEGLIADKSFRDAVFGLDETAVGESGLLAEAETGGYYAFRLDEIIPRQDRPFEELVDAIGDRWQGERKTEAAEALAESLAVRVRAGETLDALAEELELEVETTEPLARRARWPFNYMAVEMFGVTDEDVVRTAALESDFAVLVLDGVEGADFALRETREALFEREGELRIDRLNELFGQYMEALRDNYGVSVNNDLVTRIVETRHLR